MDKRTMEFKLLSYKQALGKVSKKAINAQLKTGPKISKLFKNRLKKSFRILAS